MNRSDFSKPGRVAALMCMCVYVCVCVCARVCVCSKYGAQNGIDYVLLLNFSNRQRELLCVITHLPQSHYLYAICLTYYACGEFMYN